MIEKTLFNSMVNRKTITIIYMKDSEIAQRRIQVMKIDKDYIKALDVDKNAIRTYKIDKILSAR